MYQVHRPTISYLRPYQHYQVPVLFRPTLHVSQVRTIPFTTHIIMITTLVPRPTLRGVAQLHVASGMPQWRMFVTSCYI